MASSRERRLTDGRTVAVNPNGGLRKICRCPRRGWAKCAHPWHFNFRWDGRDYRFSLDRQGAEDGPVLEQQLGICGPYLRGRERWLLGGVWAAGNRYRKPGGLDRSRAEWPQYRRWSTPGGAITRLSQRSSEPTGRLGLGTQL